MIATAPAIPLGLIHYEEREVDKLIMSRKEDPNQYNLFDYLIEEKVVKMSLYNGDQGIYKILDVNPDFIRYKDAVNKTYEALYPEDKSLMRMKLGMIMQSIDDTGRALPGASEEVEVFAKVLKKHLPRGSYRKRSEKDSDIIFDIPDHAYIPSREGYQSYLGTGKGKSKAFLRVKENNLITFGANGESYGESFIQNIPKPDNNEEPSLAEIDTRSLGFIYSLLAKKLQEDLDQGKAWDSFTTKDIKEEPTFKFSSTVANYGASAGHDDIRRISANYKSMDSLLGFIKTPHGYSYYKVLNFVGYDATQDVFIFSAPYLVRLFQAIMRESVKRTTKNPGKLLTDGRNHNHHFSTDIYKCKNERALEVALTIGDVIVRAGKKNEPNISVKKIVDRCPKLSEALKSAKNAQTKNAYLKRAFSRAFELLKDCSDFESKCGYIIPDPKKDYPTISQLDRVYRFGMRKDPEGK